MKHYLKKNIGAILIAILILLLTFIILTVKDNLFEDTSTVIQNYSIDVTVRDDGSLLIKEKVKISYEEDRTVFYRDMIYSKNDNGQTENKSSFNGNNTYVKVYNEDDELIFDSLNNVNKENVMIGYSWENDRDELGDVIACPYSNCETIFVRVPSGIDPVTTFEYQYEIIGAVTKYNDVAELNWIYGDSTGSIKQKNVSVTIHFPKESNTEDIYFYGHGTNSAKVDYIKGNEIKFSMKRSYPGELLEARIIVPTDVIPNSKAENRINKNGLDYLLSLEENTYDEAFVKTQKLLNYVGIIIMISSIGFLVVLWVKAYKKYDKEHETTFWSEYYRELPADYPPAMLGFLYNFKDVSKDDLSATLMDLIRRGYISLDTQGESLTDKDANYKMILNKAKDQSELEPYEKYLLEWFFDTISSDKETLTLDELHRYTKKESQAEKYLSCNKRFVTLVKEAGVKKDFFDYENSKPGAKFYPYIVLYGLLAIICFFLYNIYKVYSLLYSASFLLAEVILFSSYLSTIKRRSIQGNEDYVRWRAFKNFLTDFSTFEDYPMPSLIIWEHFLVYAVSFGIADLVEKQLRLKFKNQGQEDLIEYQGYYRYPYFGSRISYSVGRSITASYATISEANAQRLASSGGGGRGGFGGGRSFGGGGGGFRSR